MTELEEALSLAERLLDDASQDPDDDLRMLARQLKRQTEILESMRRTSLANNLCPDHRDKQAGKPCLACVIEQMHKQLRSSDWEGTVTTDLIHANRDQMLRMHEEAVRRIQACLKRTCSSSVGPVDDHLIKAAEVIGALWTFYPMDNSWKGWPEGSEP